MAPTTTTHGLVWSVEDDLLLMNSIEDGASLEALAKGAVQFSQRFTLKELQERWCSLLYDADLAAEASAPMVEVEIPTSNISSKFRRADKYGGTINSHKKRKLGSIWGLFYAMLKRIRRKFVDSADLGFLEYNLQTCEISGGVLPENGELDADQPPIGNDIGEDCISNHSELQPLQESDIDILGQSFPQVMAGVDATSADTKHGDALSSNLVTDNDANTRTLDDPLHEVGLSFTDKDPIGNERNTSFEQTEELARGFGHNSQDYGSCSNEKNVASSQLLSSAKLFKDDSLLPNPSPSESIENGSLHPKGLLHSQPASLPIWKTLVGVSDAAMTVDVNLGDERFGVKDSAALPDNGKGIPSQGDDEINCFITSTTITEGKYADISDSLLEFSTDNGIMLMDLIDNKNVMVVNPSNVEAYIISSDVFMTDDSINSPDTELRSINDQDNICHPTANKIHTSEMKPKTHGINKIDTYCSFNTEDLEIPFNDDIFLLIPAVSSLASPRARLCTMSSIGPVSSPNEKDSIQGTTMIWKGQDLSPNLMSSMMVSTNFQTDVGSHQTYYGYSLMSESPESPNSPDKNCTTEVFHHATNILGHPNQRKLAYPAPNAASDRKLENKNVEKVEFGASVLHSGTSLFSDVSPAELVQSPNPSTSDQEEPESDNDLPSFSDIEAMILDMDLGPYDQDSYAPRRVSRYQHVELRRRIIPLEQCSHSFIRRSMPSQSALAILYGRQSKYFIRKTEVLLGRPTEEVDVDIDLGQEGNANNISRRQAMIKMESNGSFILKNLGKSIIMVNGRTVTTGELITLSSSNCLVEIRGLSFIFQINHKSVRRHLENLAWPGNYGNMSWNNLEDAT